jgi:heat shock protein HslJ
MQLLGQRWELVDIDGEPASDARATIEFSDDGRVFGVAGVNRFTGSYEATGDTVSIGPLAATLMAGPPAMMAFEQRFLTALSGPLRVEIDGSQLELRGADHVVRFTPASISA